MRALLATVILAFAGQATTQTNTGTIEGVVVRYGTLEPIPNVQVLVTQGSLANASGTTTTDSQGRFLLRDIAVGQHAVVARRDGYFGSGSNTRNSATVAVNVERQPPVDLRLFLVPSGTIAGRVRGADGQPGAGWQVEVVQFAYDRIGRRALRPGQSVTADGNGEYRITGLAPGDYYIRAYLGFRTRTSAHHQRNSRILTTSGLQGIEMRGRITVNGETPRGRVGNALVGWASSDSRPQALLSLGDGGGGSLATVDRETGEFVIRNIPPGEFRFNYGTTLPADTYLLDARIGERSVLDEDITIGATSPGALEVIVRTPGGIVQGVVIDARQREVGGAGVALVPQTRRQTAPLYKFGTTDKDGRFTLRAIAPGEYKLFAMGTADLDMWMDPGFRAIHEARGTAVTVIDGKATSARVTLIPE